MNEYLLRLINTSLRIKEEPKVKKEKSEEENNNKLVKFEKILKAQPGCARTKASVWTGAWGDWYIYLYFKENKQA